MKKFILLLIVPLLFFNSCEEEDENNCQTEPIQCGEIINIDVNSPSSSIVVNNNGSFETTGGHEGYSIITLRKCNTGKEGTYCTSLDFENDLGDIFCPPINTQSQWGEIRGLEVINGVITPVVITGCKDFIVSGNPVTFN